MSTSDEGEGSRPSSPQRQPKPKKESKPKKKPAKKKKVHIDCFVLVKETLGNYSEVLKLED